MKKIMIELMSSKKKKKDKNAFSRCSLEMVFKFLEVCHAVDQVLKATQQQNKSHYVSDQSSFLWPNLMWYESIIKENYMSRHCCLSGRTEKKVGFRFRECV